MQTVRLSVAIPVFFLTLASTSAVDRSAPPPTVSPNDNRSPGGIVSGDTLRISLAVKLSRWYPEADDGLFVDVPVFAEEGKSPSIPGPLIRVREGTTIVATVANELSDSTIWIHGLAARPAKDDSTAVKPGAVHKFTFRSGRPGTYFYYATTGVIDRSQGEREQLAGALVVDPAKGSPEDRILMINIWSRPRSSGETDQAVAINGKSWPFTERFTVNLGDSLRWRVINGSIRPHPMHLHGFYFHINSRGSFLADTALGLDRREFVVTKHMVPRTTMSIAWSPNRPGNWLFHCHFTPHVNESARLGYSAPRADVHHDADPMKHMAGLVIGITVNDPDRRYRPLRALLPTRRLRMYAQDRPATATTPLATSYIIQRDSRPPARDSIERGGQVIVLTRGQPTRVTIVNRAHAATSVHWHGIELESYSDGVAGWSGAPSSLAPMIAPNDSFIADLILPRTGTFIYHTHLNDMEQITSGAYGPIVVLDPAEKFDPEVDHTITAGWNGMGRFPDIRLALNGDSSPPPMVLKHGKTHRLRIVNIGAAARFNFILRRDTTMVTWSPLAKDGFDLPQAARAPRAASQLISTGETFDAEWTPLRKGEYEITANNGGRVYGRMKLIVR
jgi:FtsP/CotA-like multicopper oxidase with cupredoxin domain